MTCVREVALCHGVRLGSRIYVGEVTRAPPSSTHVATLTHCFAEPVLGRSHVSPPSHTGQQDLCVREVTTLTHRTPPSHTGQQDLRAAVPHTLLHVVLRTTCHTRRTVCCGVISLCGASTPSHTPHCLLRCASVVADVWLVTISRIETGSKERNVVWKSCEPAC